MKFLRLLTIAAVFASATLASGQAPKLSAFDVSGGYTFQYLNAPPSACGCFGLSGGYGSVTYNLPFGLGLVGDVAATHASAIAGTTQSITLTDFLFGPRFSLKLPGRLTPYGQVLFGGVHETSNVSAANGLSAFAISPGGGVRLRLIPHVGLTLVEVDWIHSQLANGANNEQNSLRVNTGIVLSFGRR